LLASRVTFAANIISELHAGLGNHQHESSPLILAFLSLSDAGLGQLAVFLSGWHRIPLLRAKLATPSKE
jgi:hypothetical protein